MKKLLIFCSSWMYKKPEAEGWEIFCNIQEKDPRFSSSNKFDSRYIEAIKAIKPDFVVAVNVGCSESAFDQMPKIRQVGTKYITWSTDSYRHTRRCVTSDLHLSSIPDDTLQDIDEFVPLFFDAQYPGIPFDKRKYTLGIHCRKYDNENFFRQKHITEIQRILGNRIHVNQQEFPPFKYIQELIDYKYGLNVATYHDGLPNFRSFELGSLGVMPISSSVNAKVLRDLFEENIRLYKHPSEIPSLLKPYDTKKLINFYAEKHSLQARLTYIFKKYFSLDFKRG